jgi:hypothetical protein
MPEPSAKAAYEAAITAHMRSIAPALRRLDEEISRLGVGDEDLPVLRRLNTMRTLLVSGLFDADLYLKNYPDVDPAQIDPLEHYVRQGDQECRIPNAAFFPYYYRRQFMQGLPPEANTLEHYVNEGEGAGAQPNSAFNPDQYISENDLADFVHRPLFHFLEIGQTAVRASPATRLATIMRPLLEYVYAHPWPDLLVEAKRSLVAGLGVHEGFARYKELIDRPDQAEIRLKPIASLRDVARDSALAAYHEVAPGDEPFTVQPPTVIGEGSMRPITGMTRTMFVACLVDAQVRAGSEFIQFGEHALLDYQGDELARVDQTFEADPGLFGMSGSAPWLIGPSDSGNVAVEIEDGFPLLGVNADHFGHWMLQYLPKYIAALVSGLLPPVPVLIGSDTPKTLRQALELMLPQRVAIVTIPQHALAHVRRLWCAPTQQYFATSPIYNERFRWEYFLTPPERFVPIVREMARRIDLALPEESGPERVYLARSASFTRKLVNHTAIETAAEASGFAIVHPEQLDFSEQVRLTRSARYIMGSDGSAMFLSFFAKPGAKVSILACAEGIDAMPHMSGLLTAKGLGVTVFCGRMVCPNPDFPPGCDYEIDEAAFRRFLDRWLASEIGA